MRQNASVIGDFIMKNGKHIFLTSCILALILLAAGCDAYPVGSTVAETAADTEIADDTDSGTAVRTFAQRAEGIYSGYGDDEGEITLQIYLLDGMLLAEVSTERAAYYAFELYAEDPDALYSTDAESAEFMRYSFSGFSMLGEYWDEGELLTLSLTAEGIEICCGDGTCEYYMRDDSLEPIHDAYKYAEHLASQPGTDSLPVGTWYGATADGYAVSFTLDAGGGLFLCCKRDGEPVNVRIGTAANAGNSVFDSITERVGWGGQPYFCSTGFAVTDENHIQLENCDPDGLIPTVGPVELTIITGN